MRTILKTMTALGLVLSMGLLAAPGALAKAHDQGVGNGSPNQDGVPGTNVGSETVGPAQTQGNVQSGGQGQGPGDTPAGDSPGNSGDAGK